MRVEYHPAVQSELEEIRDYFSAVHQALAPMTCPGHVHVVNTKTISIAGTCLVPIDPALLKECPLGEEVDVSAERDALVIRPVRRQPRQGWAEALAAVPDCELARDQADLAAFRETPHDWDSKDWEW